MRGTRAHYRVGYGSAEERATWSLCQILLFSLRYRFVFMYFQCIPILKYAYSVHVERIHNGVTAQSSVNLFIETYFFLIVSVCTTNRTQVSDVCDDNKLQNKWLYQYVLVRVCVSDGGSFDESSCGFKICSILQLRHTVTFHVNNLPNLIIFLAVQSRTLLLVMSLYPCVRNTRQSDRIRTLDCSA